MLIVHQLSFEWLARQAFKLFLLLRKWQKGIHQYHYQLNLSRFVPANHWRPWWTVNIQSWYLTAESQKIYTVLLSRSVKSNRIRSTLRLQIGWKMKIQARKPDCEKLMATAMLHMAILNFRLNNWMTQYSVLFLRHYFPLIVYQRTLILHAACLVNSAIL